MQYSAPRNCENGWQCNDACERHHLRPYLHGASFQLEFSVNALFAVRPLHVNGSATTVGFESAMGK